MSLQTLAPTEKSEHLIYSILPLSFATWFASQLDVSDPIEVLAAVIAISSFGTLFLYELTIDQVLVNGFLRWKVRKRKSLKEALLVFNTTANMWEREPTNKSDWKKDYIEEQARNQVSISVNGPFIRKKVWRIRASFYLLISLYFIEGAFWQYLDAISSSEDMLDTVNPIVVYWLDNFYEHILEFYAISLFFIGIVMLVRHRKIVSNIDQLSRYSYLQRLLSVMKLQDSRLFKEGKDEDAIPSLNFANLESDLSLLNDILVADDWSGFHEGWDRTYHWIHRETIRLVQGYIAYHLMQPVGKVNEALTKVNNGSPASLLSESVTKSKRQLEWICYLVGVFKKYEEQRKNTIQNEFRSYIADRPDNHWLKKCKIPTRFKKAISYELPLPEFDTSFNKLYAESCEWGESEIQNPNKLLKIAADLGTMKRQSTEGAVLFALAPLGQAPKGFEAGEENGIKFLFTEVDNRDSPYKLNPLYLAKTILHAFESGGVGYLLSEKSMTYDAFKIIRNNRPANFDDQWNKGFSHFLKKATKEVIIHVLDDRDFVEPLVQSSAIIKNALSDIKNDKATDKAVSAKIHSYGVN